MQEHITQQNQILLSPTYLSMPRPLSAITASFISFFSVSFHLISVVLRPHTALQHWQCVHAHKLLPQSQFAAGKAQTSEQKAQRKRTKEREKVERVRERAPLVMATLRTMF